MKAWQFCQPDPLNSLELSRQLKISPLLAQMLINRGITGVKESQVFLSPRLMNLSDPFLLPNIKKAAERVIRALERGEKVAIYGDYDVDGVTGTSILIETLRHIGLDPSYYIPHRYGEGYSLNIEAVKTLKQDGINLIITVDCGISSYIEIEEANSLGMEVIVTDHHTPPAKLPNALVILNRDLSGAGVAFKFAWALIRTAGIAENSFLSSLLDLAALGTIADVVPLTQENRILAKQGLTELSERKRPGIKALAQAAGLKNDLTVRDINFGLAPRLNAAGRLEHASISVDLLLSKNAHDAQKLAEKLSRVNSSRQGIGEGIGNDVFAKIDTLGLSQEKIIIVSGEDWHPGVIGIIASRVVDKFYRPVVLIGINEGKGRGSARSIEGFNVFSLLETCRDLYKDFGGHEAAAGFEIEPENIPELKRRLTEGINALELDLTPKLKLDAEINPAQATLALVQELRMLEPFGSGNTIPVFASRGLKLTDVRKVGKESGHLKIKLSSGDARFEAIGFRMGGTAETLKPGETYDIAYSLETNVWDGFESVQFNLCDIIKA